MDGTIQEYVLDMAAGTKKEPLRVKQYDTNSRQARITLKMGGEPWTIPFGCQIHINVRKTDGTLADATCTRIDEHTVLTPITEQMTAVIGTQLGELYFLGSDGDIKSQSFPVVVYEAVMDQARIESSDDFQSLQGALRQVQISTDMADAATQYATAQGDQARDAAQRAEDAVDSIQAAVDAAANAKACESNAKNSELAAAQTQQEVTDYVEAQKAAFVGYSHRESDSKYANALTATTTGEGSVTVEDAWTAPVLGLDVVGKSEQVVTTGAQLLDSSELAIGGLAGNNGAEFETKTRVRTGYISVAGDEKYKLSGYTPYAVHSAFAYGADKTVIGSWNIDASVPQNAAYARISLRRSDEGNFAVDDLVMLKKSLMFNAGDIPLPYEPYTGGAPSPSPEYPQDIISVGTVSTGKQLFYKSLVTLQGTGAEADIIDKRAIKITYARANGGKYVGFIVDDKSNLVGKTLTISYSGIIPSKSGLTPGIRLYWIDNNGSVLSYVVYVNKSPTTITIEYPQNDAATKLALLLYADVGDAAVVNDYVIYKDIMINAGDTALPWEPYTGGKPSPSVEYPQVVEVGVTGTNLLKYPYSSATMTINGVTFTDNGDGTITANGTATQNAYYYLDNNSGNSHNTLGKNVWLSGCPAGGSLQTYVLQWFNYDGSLSAARDFGKGINFTVSEASADNYNIVIVIMAGVTANNLVFRPMLNTGDVSAPWAPYQTISAPITLTEPLRGIGEYRDRIMYRDGEWGIERQTHKMEFDGSQDEVWAVQSVNDNGITNYMYYLKIMGRKIIKASLCNRLQYDSSWIADATRNGVLIGNGTTLYIRLKEVKTLDDYRKWLTENPLIIVYPLATPTWEPLPSATQQALNELTTYAGTTHLTITAGGPAPDVTLEYVQDTQKAIEQHDTANRQYTDNQIAAIVAALPTATQAAIVDNQTTKLLQEV